MAEPVLLYPCKVKKGGMMLQDKRKDLDGERQKRLLQKLVADLSHQDPNVYYMPTAGIAARLHETIKTGGRLAAEDREILQRLTLRDIEVLLSLH
ncbi:MAG: hypothetical protein AAFO72_06735 [Pseudomonadota bacterium]